MGRRILIVDDEPNIVASLEFLLGRSGYEVRVATNGEEAIVEAPTPPRTPITAAMTWGRSTDGSFTRGPEMVICAWAKASRT